MSTNSNNFRISNEQLLLINILNTMYSDNLRQINFITSSLNNLIDTNDQIRSSLVQILNINQNSGNNNNNNRRNRYNDRREWENNNRFNTLRGSSGNQQYVDLIGIVNPEYSLPLRPTGNYINRNNQNNTFSQLLQSFLQPVEVYPTQSQIESATRRVRYCDISRPINNQCPISMVEFNDNDMVTVIRHCGHIFHTEHLTNWFNRNCRCPVCRYDIREYTTNSSTFFTEQAQNPPTIDPSNNNIERTTSTERTILNFFDNNLTRILDMSGNSVNITNDILASYLSSRLNNS
jgi:hypothetical protein